MHSLKRLEHVQAAGSPASHRVATVQPRQRCQRGVSLVCSSTRTEAGTDRAGRTLEAVLQDVGIADVLGSVRQVCVEEGLDDLLCWGLSRRVLSPIAPPCSQPSHVQVIAVLKFWK